MWNVHFSGAVCAEQRSGRGGVLPNLGAKSMYGSDDQVKQLQALAKSKCPIAGFTFRLSSPSRSTLIVADFEKGEMVRLKVDPVSRPWEKWSGFYP